MQDWEREPDPTNDREYWENREAHQVAAAATPMNINAMERLRSVALQAAMELKAGSELHERAMAEVADWERRIADAKASGQVA